jgi:hypothetical protein
MFNACCDGLGYQSGLTGQDVTRLPAKWKAMARGFRGRRDNEHGTQSRF